MFWMYFVRVMNTSQSLKHYRHMRISYTQRYGKTKYHRMAEMARLRKQMEDNRNKQDNKSNNQ